MFRLPKLAGRVGAVPLALAVLSLVPGASYGAWFGFRNDLNRSVVVQAVTVVNGVARERPRVLLLAPGEVRLDPVIPPVSKLIIVSDPKTNRVLYQDTISVANDAFFSLQLSSPDKVKLVPAKLPIPPNRPQGAPAKQP
jgi:hypothetical protein